MLFKFVINSIPCDKKEYHNFVEILLHCISLFPYIKNAWKPN